MTSTWYHPYKPHQNHDFLKLINHILNCGQFLKPHNWKGQDLVNFALLKVTFGCQKFYGQVANNQLSKRYPLALPKQSQLTLRAWHLKKWFHNQSLIGQIAWQG